MIRPANTTMKAKREKNSPIDIIHGIEENHREIP